MAVLTEKILEIALQAARNVQRATEKSLYLSEISEIFLEYGKRESGLDFLAEAVKIINNVKQPPDKVNCLVRAAKVYVIAGQAASARQICLRAERLAGASDPASRILALYNIASQYADSNLNNEANRLLTQLQQIVSQSGNEIDTFSELTRIADLYIILGQGEKAVTCLQEALKVSAGIKDDWFKIERMVSIAERYGDLGKSRQASELLEETLLLLDRANELNQAYFLIKLADISIGIGRNDQSLEILASVLRIITVDEGPYSGAYHLLEVAERYIDLGYPDNASDLLIRSASIIEGSEDELDRITIFVRIAGLWGLIAQNDRAKEMAKRALQLAEKVKNGRTRVFFLGTIAVLYIDLEQRDKAVEIVSVLVQSFKEHDIKTAGLGEISSDIAASGEISLALRLAELIHEPHVRARTFLNIAWDLVLTDTGH